MDRVLSISTGLDWCLSSGLSCYYTNEWIRFVSSLVLHLCWTDYEVDPSNNNNGQNFLYNHFIVGLDPSIYIKYGAKL